LVQDRPTHFPSVFAWLSLGMGRSWRGILAALIGTWFYLPLALIIAVVAAVFYGVLGFAGGQFGVPNWVPAWVVDTPVLGDTLDSFLVRYGGLAGGLLGALFGLVLGFLGGLVVLWGFEGDPVASATSALSMAAAGLIVGAIYTGYRITWESSILRMSGARRLSRRERELLVPILRSCTQRLGLKNYPPIMMDDTSEPYAAAHTRNIVLSRGLLAELGYDREAIAGVLCHELVHWRNGDAISAAFIRGIALPLYLLYGWVGWLTQRIRHPLMPVLVWVFLWPLLWPILVTVRFFIIPLHAMDIRRAEFRADQGAVLAGHRDGLRRAIARVPEFEGGRNGWTRAVCASHPAAELRLERLEDPDRRYPLPDPDPPAGPADPVDPAPAGQGTRR
jgi:Zn-dependent protease with chaperone function